MNIPLKTKMIKCYWLKFCAYVGLESYFRQPTGSGKMLLDISSCDPAARHCWHDNGDQVRQLIELESVQTWARHGSLNSTVILDLTLMTETNYVPGGHSQYFQTPFQIFTTWKCSVTPLLKSLLSLVSHFEFKSPLIQAQNVDELGRHYRAPHIVELDCHCCTLWRKSKVPVPNPAQTQAQSPPQTRLCAQQN